MTEEEAKTKWCPFARVQTKMGPGGGYNRIALPQEGFTVNVGADCIGSACMAWEWRVPPPPNQVGPYSGEGDCGLKRKP